MSSEIKGKCYIEDNKSKINIGDAFERWRHGVKWHEVTVLLLL